jgi:hypothetical protein
MSDGKLKVGDGNPMIREGHGELHPLFSSNQTRASIPWRCTTQDPDELYRSSESNLRGEDNPADLTNIASKLPSVKCHI